MGCWEETDAITHTPIHHKEPVVMVILTKDGANGRWWMGSWFDIPRCIREIHKGTYNDYGWINELPYDNTPYEERSDHHFSVFFRQSVWDAICKRHPPQRVPLVKKWDWEDEKIPDFLDELVSVMNFGSSCRLDLGVGICYKGHQSHYRQDKRAYDFYLKLVGEAWDSLTARYIENGGDPDKPLPEELAQDEGEEC